MISLYSKFSAQKLAWFANAISKKSTLLGVDYVLKLSALDVFLSFLFSITFNHPSTFSFGFSGQISSIQMNILGIDLSPIECLNPLIFLTYYASSFLYLQQEFISFFPAPTSCFCNQFLTSLSFFFL